MHWFWRGMIAVAVASIYCMLTFVLQDMYEFDKLVKAGSRYVAGNGIVGVWSGALLLFFIFLVVPNLIALGTYSLLTCRYGPKTLDNETRCRKCGYILRGISEPRCSECGERI